MLLPETLGCLWDREYWMFFSTDQIFVGGGAEHNVPEYDVIMRDYLLKAPHPLPIVSPIVLHKISNISEIQKVGKLSIYIWKGRSNVSLTKPGISLETLLTSYSAYRQYYKYFTIAIFQNIEPIWRYYHTRFSSQPSKKIFCPNWLIFRKMGGIAPPRPVCLCVS